MQDATSNRMFSDFLNIDMREMKLRPGFDQFRKRQNFASGSLGASGGSFADAPTPTPSAVAPSETNDAGDNVITANPDASAAPSDASTVGSTLATTTSSQNPDFASASSGAGNLTQTPTSGGLTTAAKIGIGLGVPLGLIVLGAIIFGMYWYGKRQGRKKDTSPAAPAPEVSQAIPEADGRPYYGNELWTQGNVVEMPANKAIPTGMPQRPAELYGSRFR
jgi:hypothetical protein